MRGSSGASLAQVRERFEPVLRTAGEGALALGQQLFAVTAALDASAPLRRSLTDPSRSGGDKAGLVTAILGDGFDERVIDLLAGMVRARWARESDLPDAVERIGIDAVLASAESRGALVRVEDELFRTSRALVGSREVREVLSDGTTAPARRRAVVVALLGAQADPVTLVLAEHATVALRGRRFVPSLGWFGEIAAERRRRLVASVTSAVVLDQAQLERLSGLLERAYGRAVQLNVTVDPVVVGGLRIQVGADVVDSTVLSRLADARRRLVS